MERCNLARIGSPCPEKGQRGRDGEGHTAAPQEVSYLVVRFTNLLYQAMPCRPRMSFIPVGCVGSALTAVCAHFKKGSHWYLEVSGKEEIKERSKVTLKRQPCIFASLLNYSRILLSHL